MGRVGRGRREWGRRDGADAGRPRQSRRIESNPANGGWQPPGQRERDRRGERRAPRQPADRLGELLSFQVTLCLILLLLFGVSRLTGGVLGEQGRQLARLVCGVEEAPFRPEQFRLELPSSRQLAQAVERLGEDIAGAILLMINGTLAPESESEEGGMGETPLVVGESEEESSGARQGDGEGGLPTFSQMVTGTVAQNPRAVMEGMTSLMGGLAPGGLWSAATVQRAQLPWQRPEGDGGLHRAVTAGGGQGGWLPARRGKEPPAGATFQPYLLTSRLWTPVPGRVTSLFGYRDHPITGEEDFHSGIDIAAPQGTSVHTALPGRVVEAGWSDAYGWRVVVQHSPRLQTSYSHCSELLVEEGLNLAQGDRVALVGSTGISTGPHLHFEILLNGQKADPALALFPAGGV